jgi:hypothetical protein
VKRREFIKHVVVVITGFLIPLVWLLPIGIYWTSVSGGGSGGDWEYHNVYTIWACGWESADDGWFGLDPYTDLVDMQFYMGAALAYAIIASLSLAWQSIIAWKGGRPRSTGVLLAFVALYQLFVSMICHVVLVLGIVHGAAAVALWACQRLYMPFSGEKELFQRTARAIGHTGMNMQTTGRGDVVKSDVDKLRHNLDWLHLAAHRVGIDVANELRAGYNALPNLEARCSMRDAIKADGTASVDHLLAVSGLKREQFDSLLLDMCRQLDLSTDGTVVSPKHEKGATDLLQEIDAYFTQWRDAEAIKLGKI